MPVTCPRFLWIICYQFLIRFVYICYAYIKLSVVLSKFAVPVPTLSTLSISVSASASALSTPSMSSVAHLLCLYLVHIFYGLSIICALFALSASVMPLLGHPPLHLHLLYLCLHRPLYLHLHLRLRLRLRLLFIISLN